MNICPSPTTQQSVSEMERYKRAQIAVIRHLCKQKVEHHCQSPTTQQSVSEMERCTRVQIMFYATGVNKKMNISASHQPHN